MYYIILSGSQEDRRDVVVVANLDGSARVFSTSTEAKEWAEENLYLWYKVVSV